MLRSAVLITRRGLSRFGSVRKDFYLTIPIFYVNGDPHIGHLYTALLGDAICRWERMKNEADKAACGDYIYGVGTDEHGSKIASALAKSGMRSLEEQCDVYSRRFRELFHRFNICYTDFVRTTDARHRVAVEHFWSRLKATGHIHKGTYEGWYSVVDECFYPDSSVARDESSGSTTMIVRETGSRVERVQEKNYMFDMGPFEERIRRWLIDSDVIQPTHYLPLALQFLRGDEENGAQSSRLLSVSRDSSRLKWGIPVPDDPSQTIYVWLDALVSYMTLVGYPGDMLAWPPSVQILGKDILRFHAIYWPAFLMAADLPLPRKLFVHGHWLANWTKMSKSTGNVVDPSRVVDEDGVSVEGLRYFLLRSGLPQEDSNFTPLKAISVVNTDLVNELGNLLMRAVGAKLNPAQLYPEYEHEALDSLGDDCRRLVAELSSLRERVSANYEQHLFHRGLEAIARVVQQANRFFHHHSPWATKERDSKYFAVLFLTYETVRIAAVLLQPVVPDYADRLLSRLGVHSPSERLITTAQLGGNETMRPSGRRLGDKSIVPMERIRSDSAE